MLSSFILSALFLATSAFAGPIAPPVAQDIVNSQPISFNNYNNILSLNGFDDFRGVDNFDGSRNAQVVVVQEQQQVCRTQQIAVVQQRLIVLQEMAKRILTEQVCDVVTQTVILQQLQSGLTVFQRDVERVTTRQVGFDQQIAAMITQIINADGTLSEGDLGFSGIDVGNQTVVVSGNNWDDAKSPEAVKKAKEAAQEASKKSTEENKKADESNDENKDAEEQNKNSTDAKPARRWFVPF
ncbi:hypothetical protein Moror_17111 [Moniliophthora roreri MCA 2997]|uniref:Uncharacterized protein n=2 Tax=Moniliophthora roreri TaxID=221103 RepID=V2X4P4_MONRO|nr:hypothetical protein Moror_17111 [Moniliophthora roreri MCA 2997]KAI3604687.1 hypothetical protein WG66_008682 [Moniliophthora roreri]